MNELQNKIMAALGDPDAPWYGSDLVSWVGDYIERTKELEAENIELGDGIEKVNNACVKIRRRLERRLLEHLKGHSLEAVCSDCANHYWYIDDEVIVCPHCRPKEALK
jgi:hypothetical protein